MTTKIDTSEYRQVGEAAQGAVVLQSGVLDLPGVVHGFGTRLGGVSGGAFSSLNFGLKGGDDAANVQQNLALMGQRVGFDPARAFRVSQVHGAEVVVVGADDDPARMAQQQADALVSATPGISVGVNTADCVSVLLADAGRGVVAAAHAGWRGVVAGVLDATVTLMVQRFGVQPRDLRAALGPSIGSCCFEVGEEVAEQFAGLSGVVQRQANRARPHLDLHAVVCQQLAQLGLGAVGRTALCTRCEEELLFSYRRAGPGTGHHLSVVGLQ